MPNKIMLLRVGVFGAFILALFRPASAYAQGVPQVDPLYTVITNQAVDTLLSFRYFLLPKNPQSGTTITFSVSNGATKTALTKGIYTVSGTPPQGMDVVVPEAITVAAGSDNLAVGIVPQGRGRLFTYTTPESTKLPKQVSKGFKLPLIGHLFAPKEIAVLPYADTNVLGVLDTATPQNAQTTLTTTVYTDLNQNGKQDLPQEATNTANTLELTLTKVDSGRIYSLLNGWNLVHFPLKPTTFTTAKELVTEIAKEGGYVSVVATWQDGKWLEYVQRGSDAYSPDFPIEPGKAYFLRSHRKMDWLVAGTPVSPTPLKLIPGWNSIGLFLDQGQSAQNVLDAIAQAAKNKEAATEIDRWVSGHWQVFVKRWYDDTNIQQYGDDFTLRPQDGYMIKADDFVTLILKNTGEQP